MGLLAACGPPGVEPSRCIDLAGIEWPAEQVARVEVEYPAVPDAIVLTPRLDSLFLPPDTGIAITPLLPADLTGPVRFAYFVDGPLVEEWSWATVAEDSLIAGHALFGGMYVLGRIRGDRFEGLLRWFIDSGFHNHLRVELDVPVTSCTPEVSVG